MAGLTFDQRALLVAHARTYHAFTLLIKWVCIALGTTLAFLVTSFGAGAGMGWGFVLAILVGAAGIYAMRHGLSHSSEEEEVKREADGD
jgi:hypothetical protein